MNKEQELSTFFLAFSGQQVIITVNMMANDHSENEEFKKVHNYPVFYEGVLLDEDSNYYFLGKTPNEITQAVNKKFVMHIQTFEEKEVFDQILDDMPEPESNEEVN